MGKIAARQKTKRVTRDGSTLARALLEDQSEWRRRECPGFTCGLQILRPFGDKHIDQLLLLSPSGDECRTVFFDVSKNFRMMRQWDQDRAKRGKKDQDVPRRLRPAANASR